MKYTVAVVVPLLYCAVTVYEIPEVVTVGVPVISPVEELMLKPAGKLGEIVNVPVPIPPDAIGEVAVIAELTKKFPFCG